MANRKRTPAVDAADEQRFKQLRRALLERAGGGLSLRQGAERLGITREALYEQIESGTVLGLMDGQKLVLPRLQFIGAGEEVKLVEGLPAVVKLFEDTGAGGWSALQFLIGRDPNLEAAPIEALQAGEVKAVVEAARTYLGLDEG